VSAGAVIRAVPMHGTDEEVICVGHAAWYAAWQRNTSPDSRHQTEAASGLH